MWVRLPPSPPGNLACGFRYRRDFLMGRVEEPASSEFMSVKRAGSAFANAKVRGSTGTKFRASSYSHPPHHNMTWADLGNAYMTKNYPELQKKVKELYKKTTGKQIPHY